jgi:hypothetical protein
VPFDLAGMFSFRREGDEGGRLFLDPNTGHVVGGGHVWGDSRTK